MMGQLGEIMRRQNGPHSLSSGVVFIVVLWIMSLVSQQEAQSDFFENGETRQAIQLNGSSINISSTPSSSVTLKANSSVISVNNSAPNLLNVTTLPSNISRANETLTSKNSTINSTLIVSNISTLNQTEVNNTSLNPSQSSQNLNNANITASNSSTTTNSTTILQPAAVIILVNQTNTSPEASTLSSTMTSPNSVIGNLVNNSSNGSLIATTPTSTNNTTNNSSVSDRTTPVLIQLSNGTGITISRATLPSIFILGPDSSTQSSSSVVSSVSPVTTHSSTPLIPTVTPTTTPASLRETSLIAVASDATTRPSIVVNIDIHLGPSSSPATSSSIAAATVATLSPITVSSSPVISTDTTVPTLTSPGVISSGMSTINGTLTGKTTSIPTLAAASALSVASNGTQVVCFSLPFDLLERLLPLIASLGVGGASQITLSSTATSPRNIFSNSTPLFNPITPILMPTSTASLAPITIAVTTIAANTATIGPLTIPQTQSETTAASSSTPSASYPFLGPFGVGSYGGFRPAIENYTLPPQASPGPWTSLTYSTPPGVLSSTRSVITEARPLNLLPNLHGAAGVIPYYTYPPLYTENKPLIVTTQAPPRTFRPDIIAIQSYNNGYLANGAAPSAYTSSSVWQMSASPTMTPAAPASSGSGYGGWANQGSWPIPGPSTNTGYSSPQTAFSGSNPSGGSGTPVIGMPGYAFSGSSAGGAYGGGLQAVMVQASNSWQYQQPLSTWSPTLPAAVINKNVNKALTADKAIFRQFHLAGQEEHDQSIVANNYLCNWQDDLVPDAMTVTQDGIMHIFVGNTVFGLRDGMKKKKRAVWMGKVWDRWPGIDSNIKNITAATTRQDGTTFLFSGENYWKFDNNYQMASDSPRKVTVGFPGVSQIDSVYQAPSSNGDMNFVQGGDYYSYNHRRFPPYLGPLPLKNLGLPDAIQQINAAYTDWNSQDVVLVIGHLMYKLSAGKLVSGYPQALRNLFDC